MHIVNGLPLYGRTIMKPGPVSHLSKEDTRAELAYRYYHIARAMNLSDAQRRALPSTSSSRTSAGTDGRLALADSGGNLVATDLAERLIAPTARRVSPWSSSIR